MREKKAADNLTMLNENDEQNITVHSKEQEIIIRISDNAILNGNMLKVTVKDALEIIANLAVQVALNA